MTNFIFIHSNYSYLNNHFIKKDRCLDLASDNIIIKADFITKKASNKKYYSFSLLILIILCEIFLKGNL